MRLTVLGCAGPYPGPGEATSGYLLEQGETRLLLECGSGVISRLWQHIGPQELTAVLLSHLHADHCADLLVLRYQLAELLAGGERVRLPVYAPEEPQAEFALLTQVDAYDAHLWMPGEKVRLGDVRVTCHATRHPVPSFAMRLEAGDKVLLYTGDTNTTEGLADFARGADLLLADGLFLQADWQPGAPHMSAALCAQLAKEAGVGQLVLTHLHPLRDRDALLKEAAEIFPQTALAREGAVWTL